jgi:hypothetical protein
MEPELDIELDIEVDIVAGMAVVRVVEVAKAARATKAVEKRILGLGWDLLRVWMGKEKRVK